MRSQLANLPANFKVGEQAKGQPCFMSPPCAAVFGILEALRPPPAGTAGAGEADELVATAAATAVAGYYIWARQLAQREGCGLVVLCVLHSDLQTLRSALGRLGDRIGGLPAGAVAVLSPGAMVLVGAAVGQQAVRAAGRQLLCGPAGPARLQVAHRQLEEMLAELASEIPAAVHAAADSYVSLIDRKHYCPQVAPSVARDNGGEAAGLEQQPLARPATGSGADAGGWMRRLVSELVSPAVQALAALSPVSAEALLPAFIDQPLQALAAHMLRDKLPISTDGAARLAAEVDHLRQWLEPEPPPPPPPLPAAGGEVPESEESSAAKPAGKGGARKWLSAAVVGELTIGPAVPAWLLFERVLALMAAASDLDQRGRSGPGRAKKLAVASGQLHNAKLWLGLWRSGNGAGCGVCGSNC